MPLDVRWCSAFLDLAPDPHGAATAFWSAVTGYGVSVPRGDASEFTTLVSRAGDDHLRIQRLGAGPSGVHLDLHVDDLNTSVALAAGLGATVRAEPAAGCAVLASPAGLAFCLVRHPASTRAAPARWGTHHSVVDQVCLDVRADAAEAEARFWSELTGWEPQPSRSGPTFRPLLRPPGQPLRLMVQAVGDERRPATAHLDLACDDRAAEVDRHVGLGAVVTAVTQRFTSLTDPTGRAYCVTDRDPVTGLLP